MSDLAASNSPLVTDVKADYNSVKQVMILYLY